MRKKMLGGGKGTNKTPRNNHMLVDVPCDVLKCIA